MRGSTLNVYRRQILMSKVGPIPLRYADLILDVGNAYCITFDIDLQFVIFIHHVYCVMETTSEIRIYDYFKLKNKIVGDQ